MTVSASYIALTSWAWISSCVVVSFLLYSSKLFTGTL